MMPPALPMPDPTTPPGRPMQREPRDLPILFSAPMIRALLAGQKTETRRVIKGDVPKVRHVPGDRLWVRETWKPHSTYAAMKPGEMPPSRVFYRADDSYAPSGTKWVPGIHMPRWASRITLLVRDARVERLQDITDAGCVAEGAPVDPDHRHTTQDGSGPPMVACGPARWRTVRAWYHLLWDELHAHDGYGWDANPWVTVTRFAMVRGNIDGISVGYGGQHAA